MEHASDFNSPIGEAFPIPEDPTAYDFPEVQHTPGMPEGQYEHWCELVQLFKVVFAVEIAKGGADLPEWVVHIKSGAIFDPTNYRRLAGAMAEALKERLELLARMSVIIPVLALFASNIVMAAQKGAYRMCVNYKPLNAETEDLKFPIPNLPDMLQFLKGKKVFTVLDNRLGYHQLRVHESAQRFLAFQCQFGIFTWLLCPMGPKTMPSWYTFLMTSIVFVGLMYTTLVCYFDDCVIASDTFEQHYIDVKTVLQRLADRKLVLKGSKCQIARTTIKFLGYVITSNTIAHDPERVKQVMKIEPPHTAHKLQTFLGLANYFHAFVRGYSVIRKPLNAMINEKPFRWNDERIAAFYKLRQAINDIPTLFHIDYNLSIYLDVDASQQGFFGYLFQLSTSHINDHPTVNQLTLNPDDMRYHQPLGFISHAFSGPQLKWNNTVREVFGITYCIIGFKSVLHSSHFYCRTDHKNFLEMRSSDNPIVNHCLDKLIPYFVTFIFNSGVRHCIPDLGSRAMLLHNFQKYDIADPTATATMIAHVYTDEYSHRLPSSKHPINDTAAETRMLYMHTEHTTKPTPTIAPWRPPCTTLSAFPVLADAEDTTLPITEEEDQPEPRVVNDLPTPLFIDSPPARVIADEHLKILRHFHPLNRHQGVTRTLQAIKKAGHYWPTMRQDTVHFVQTCPICQLTWRIPRAAHIHLDTFEAYDPFYYLTMDFMGPYPKDSQGNCHYLCIIDTFTRYVEIFATPDETAHTASLCLLAIYSRYTLPRIIGQCIATDNGPAFISSAFTGLLHLIGAEQSYSLPYRHQTTVERNNEEVLRYTRVLTLERRGDKELTLETCGKLIMKIVNTSVHSDTNCASHEMVHGIYSPLDLPLQDGERFATPRSARGMLKDIAETQIRLLRAAQRYQARNTDLYLLPNLEHPQLMYRIGHLVTVRYPPAHPDPSPKTNPKVMGPFQILQRDNNKYTVLDLVSQKEHVYHFSRLRLFNFSEYHLLTPREIALRNSLEFDVEAILDHRGDPNFRKTLQFLVKFTGYDETYNEWLSTNSVCRHPLMPQYLEKFPNLRRTVMRF